ncbi:MAG: hypothetical protein WBA63_08375 [Thermomicrobiales bacterium]
MEAHRFDALSKTFATKVSRRSAVRGGGAGLAATFLAAIGLRGASAQQSTAPYFTTIRHYHVTGSTDQVQGELNSGFLPIISQAAGFVEYSVVVSEGAITTITVFQSQAQFEAASQSEENWVQQNLSSLLPNPAEVTRGDATVFDLNTDLICGPAPTPVPTATTAPTAAATATPEACTGIGCPCNGGVQNACDEGLVCCQSQMNGGPIPGGAGMCAAADACGDENATPVS